MARSRLHKRYTKNPCGGGVLKSNPPLFTELLEFVGPGFAAFAATRFGTRIATTQVAKLKPNMGKHAGAGISVAAFLAAWFLGHKVKFLEKYHTPITVGAAIAALQSLIQLYIPKLGWMVADASPELDAAAIAAATPQLAAVNPNLQQIDDDPNEYTYNDSYDAGRYSKPTRAPGQSPPIIGKKTGVDQADIDDLSIDDAISGSLSGSSLFSTPN
jgi:hypothetical protein